MPWRMPSRAPRQGNVIGRHEFIPALAVFKVSRIELPAFGGITHTLPQTHGLFFLGNVEHEFQDSHAILHQDLFKLVDFLIAPLNRLRAGITFDLDDKHILIMRPVENPDIAFWRHHSVNAPEIVVRQFFRDRGLERRNLHTNRTAAVEHGLDRAVLAGTVNPLQDHQQGPLALRIQTVLQLINLH